MLEFDMCKQYGTITSSTILFKLSEFHILFIFFVKVFIISIGLKVYSRGMFSFQKTISNRCCIKFERESFYPL